MNVKTQNAELAILKATAKRLIQEIKDTQVEACDVLGLPEWDDLVCAYILGNISLKDLRKELKYLNRPEISVS